MIELKQHKYLNEKVWRKDGTLRPDVEDVLIRTYIGFMTVLASYSDLPLDLDADIIDVVLCGSGAGYTYRKKSDIDMNIIIRPDRYLAKMNADIFDAQLCFIRSFFNKKYSPNVSGIRIDILVMAKSLDIVKYSLVHKKWLSLPERLTPEDIKYINHRAGMYYKVMLKNSRIILKDKNKHDGAAQYFYTLNARRAKSWGEMYKNKNPFATAFSAFKMAGYPDKLIDADKAYVRKLITDVHKNIN